jgi:hypothetical protein
VKYSAQATSNIQRDSRSNTSSLFPSKSPLASAILDKPPDFNCAGTRNFTPRRTTDSRHHHRVLKILGRGQNFHYDFIQAG